MDIYYVESIYPCDVPGCRRKCVIVNGNRNKGRRCLKHAPKNWIREADKNEDVRNQDNSKSKVIQNASFVNL